MKRPLLLVGGGGHCKSVIEAIDGLGYNILGILDLPKFFGKNICGYSVIGTDEDIEKYVGQVDFLITLGFIKDASVRVRLYNLIKEIGGKMATIVAKSALLSKNAKVGEGTVLLHNSFVNSDSQIGENVIINDFACIEHDVVVGSHTHISTGAILNGNCSVGARCFVGSRAVVVNGVNICDEVIIGAGGVVVNDITERGVYVGNPIKKLK
ncbi:MAG: acetyltransferase [Bacteroidales bacterium]|nr:acetyltransferase [Bacteroidales bacterium]